MMKTIAMIPARLMAARFPKKLLQPLGGKTVLQCTYERTLNTGLFEQVIVVTDSDEIEASVLSYNGTVFRSQQSHECGSNRIAEAAAHMDADIILNVQGDEPFIESESLSRLLDVFKQDTHAEIDLASLMTPLHNKEDIENPNVVKVIVDQNNFAIYFSRSVIPYPRDPEMATHFKHKGVYAFRKPALLDFYQTPPTPLESAEKIECIRYLEVGKRIKMVHTPHDSVGIDTPDDLLKAEKIWQSNAVR